MAGKVFNLDDYLQKDQLGCAIANQWMEWNSFRQEKLTFWQELRQYLYATDTRKTSNSALPWKNTTTIPKLTQISDNLYANYMAAMFPKRKFIKWEGDTKNDASKEKAQNIEAYMNWVIQQDRYEKEMGKCVQDYIQYGNAFATVEWVDQSQVLADGTTKVGFVGPSVRRISPLDIVFNPTAPNFLEAPKIVRSIISFGEVKAILERESTDENRQAYEELFKYLKDVRTTVKNQQGGEFAGLDDSYRVDGFSSFQNYLQSDYVEVLTFYGDIYDWETDTFLKNHVIMVVDRHKVISKKPNPSYFGYPPIFHAAWRVSQDNLWGMGPLDNLVGMQYRIDHIENLKADVFDVIAFPVFKITGYVQDFQWKPGAKIYQGDDGNVELVIPPFQVLQANQELQGIIMLMEEMAGAPKEAMGFRTPGEKTAFEVQRMENAASRIFNNKIVYFEKVFQEPLLNAKLEMARRNITSTQTVSIFDERFNFQKFIELTPRDITGAGQIKPLAARHFAEKAEMVQNLNNFANSALGQDPAITVHMSGFKTAKLMEELLGFSDYALVGEFVRLEEQAEGERLAQVYQEQNAIESQTPAGLTPDDHSESVDAVPQPPPMELET